MSPLVTTGLHFIVFLGSVRENRNADRVKNYLTNQLNRRNISFDIFDPKELNYTKVIQPLHYYPNQSDAPQHLRDHSQQIQRANGYIIVSPEYHGAMAPALTTLMDQFPALSFAMKPAAIVSYSKGQYGGIRAAMQLRVYLSELGMIHLPSILSIPKVEDNVTQDGQVTNPTIQNSTEAVIAELIWFAHAVEDYASIKSILYKGKAWRM